MKGSGCVLPTGLADAEKAAQDLCHDTYVVPKSRFLPLPIRRDNQPFGLAHRLACSYPTSQHDPGECSKCLGCLLRA